jgi:hypothetical protein
MADPTPASVPTPNYNFNLPTVGGDDNVWGGLLNDNWSSIDTILWNVSGVASAALTQTAGDARYLRLTGGAVTGNTSFPAIVATSGIAGDGSGNPPSLFIDPPAADNSAKVPSTRWVTANMVPLAGATMTGPLVLAGMSTAPLAPPGANTSQIASTAFVAAAVAALPAPPGPSTTLPLMDGTAAIGTSALFARADHVHPSDTSRAPVASPTFTGTVTLAADPAANLQAATKQYVDAGVAFGVSAGAFGGFVNKFRNGTFDVWQRGTPVAVAASGGFYTADGWLAVATGAATTVQQGANNRVGGSRYYLAILAATGLTGFNIRQRIESQIAAPLAGQTCTFSCWMFNNTAASATPTLAVNHPTAENNFVSTVADLAATNLQPCAVGVWTRVAYTWAQPQASQSLGLEIVLTLGGALNAASGSFILSDADVRATPGVATGLNASPPPPELRPTAIEIPYCQRYYLNRGSYGTFFCGNVTSGLVYYAAGGFPSSMRATPTIVLTGNTSNTNFPAAVGTVSSTSINGFLENRTASASAVGIFGSTFTASAEL